MAWWFRKPWWSNTTNGKLLVMVVTFVLTTFGLFNAPDWQFKFTVSAFVAIFAARLMADSLRDEPPHQEPDAG